jgi:hypothetical protein
VDILNQFIASQSATNEYDACRRVVRKHFAKVEVAPGSDIERLAKSKNIDVQRNPSLRFDGMIERDGVDGTAKITLKQGLSKRRERFTLAHELGHWMLQEEMLGSTAGRLFRGLSTNDEDMRSEERLANLIAAEILMPLEHIEREYDNTHPLLSVTDICRRFCVSRIAAVRRIADVCQLHLIFLQLIPSRLRDMDSVIQVDDAIFASSREGTLFARERTKVLGKAPFRPLVFGKNVRLHLETPKGVIDSEFDTTFRPNPVPHAFALAAMTKWNQTPHKMAIS